jgi:hypothetical protein
VTARGRNPRTTTKGETMSTTTSEVTCLDGPDGCKGAVEYRHALSATGRSFARCDGHWSARLVVQAGINRRYPDQPTPPRGFDPTYAGESWDED